MTRKIHRNRSPRRANLADLVIVDSKTAHRDWKHLRPGVYGAINKGGSIVHKVKNDGTHKFVNDVCHLPNILKERIMDFENDSHNSRKRKLYLMDKVSFVELSNPLKKGKKNGKCS